MKSALFLIAISNAELKTDTPTKDFFFAVRYSSHCMGSNSTLFQ